MKKYAIDINCDVGEGLDNEAELLPLISSCNIACGGHAGDEKTMTKVVRLAKKNKVRVGAHPSYPDRANFGRVSMAIRPDELIRSIQGQIDRFMNVLNKESVTIHHIKPHGALYNDMATTAELAKTFLRSIVAYKDSIYLYVPYNSVIEVEALKQNFTIKYEAFGDRNYHSDLTLVSRTQPNALIEQPEAVLSHMLSMITSNRLETPSGERVKILADTFCIHGDTPTALQILTYLTKTLAQHNIYIERE